MNIGEKIYQLRTEKNLSQGDLADILQVSRQSVSKWENDTAVPDLDKLIKLCDVFEISLDEIVGREKPQKKSVSKWSDFKKSLTKTQNIGCVLATITLLCLIIPLGPFFALPIGACAIICFFVKSYAWYWCICAAYLPIQIFINYINTLLTAYIMETVFIITMTVIVCIKLKEFVFKVKNEKLCLVLSVAYLIVYAVFVFVSINCYNTFLSYFAVFIGKLLFAIVNAGLTLALVVTITYIVCFIREAREKKKI